MLSIVLWLSNRMAKCGENDKTRKYETHKMWVVLAVEWVFSMLWNRLFLQSFHMMTNHRKCEIFVMTKQMFQSVFEVFIFLNSSHLISRIWMRIKKNKRNASITLTFQNCEHHHLVQKRKRWRWYLGKSYACKMTFSIN